jgi:hypothetical protein
MSLGYEGCISVCACACAIPSARVPRTRMYARPRAWAPALQPSCPHDPKGWVENDCMRCLQCDETEFPCNPAMLTGAPKGISGSPV